MKKENETPSNDVLHQVEVPKNENYVVGEKYPGYLRILSSDCMQFEKKKKCNIKNKLVTVASTGDFTLQNNENCIKLTISINKANGSFSTLLRQIDKAVQEIAKLKLLSI